MVHCCQTQGLNQLVKKKIQLSVLVLIVSCNLIAISKTTKITWNFLRSIYYSVNWSDSDDSKLNFEKGRDWSKPVKTGQDWLSICTVK